jgi:hypothetical protein
MSVSVNGKIVVTGKPGTYFAINRHWSNGDAIDFMLPVSVRVKRYKGEDQIPGKSRCSVEYGPILLAAVGSSNIDLSVDSGHEVEHLANHLEPIDGSPLHFSVRGNPGQKFMPYWSISEEEFTCYPRVSVRA